MLAGEATAGTYRMILTRPVSRFSVVTAKFFAALIYVNALILWMSVLSLGLSVLFFGKGELLIIGSKITILQESDILWRFGLSYMYASLSMTTVASLAFSVGIGRKCHRTYRGTLVNHHRVYNHLIA